MSRKTLLMKPLASQGGYLQKARSVVYLLLVVFHTPKWHMLVWNDPGIIFVLKMPLNADRPTNRQTKWRKITTHTIHYAVEAWVGCRCHLCVCIHTLTEEQIMLALSSRPYQLSICFLGQRVKGHGHRVISVESVFADKVCTSDDCSSRQYCHSLVEIGLHVIQLVPVSQNYADIKESAFNICMLYVIFRTVGRVVT